MILKPTNSFRWVKTDEYDKPVSLTWKWMKRTNRNKQVGSVPTKYKLQQAWMGSDGSTRWKDIEIAED